MADGNIVAVDDDGYGPFAAAHREHFFHARRVGLHIEILDVAIRIGLTGLGGVRSSRLAVNLNHGEIVSDEAANVIHVPAGEIQFFGGPGDALDVVGSRRARLVVPLDVRERGEERSVDVDEDGFRKV